MRTVFTKNIFFVKKKPCQGTKKLPSKAWKLMKGKIDKFYKELKYASKLSFISFHAITNDVRDKKIKAKQKGSMHVHPPMIYTSKRIAVKKEKAVPFNRKFENLFRLA